MDAQMQLQQERQNLQTCGCCHMRQLCFPIGLRASELKSLEQVISYRKYVKHDCSLYLMGDAFDRIYVVRAGHFKIQKLSAGGERQIVGFHMAGEFLGMDGINMNVHQCDAIALEDSQVCEIPFQLLEGLLVQVPTLLRHFHRLMSYEITREQNDMLSLGRMRAEQRLAMFLLNLSVRYGERGYSSSEFQLRMSRTDIGDYLGLTIESVSRLIYFFKKSGLIEVDKRFVRLVDLEKLKDVAAGTQGDDQIICFNQ